jgi:K+-sensing histidine kinase KdpD
VINEKDAFYSVYKKAISEMLVYPKYNVTSILIGDLKKAFQPTFTTRPTGQGTGLGLSLSYDMVTAHGGELKVKTNEGQGSF